MRVFIIDAFFRIVIILKSAVFLSKETD